MAAPNLPQAHTAPAPAPIPPPEPKKREILIISHCSLFYWWPVWLVGFILGTVSYFSGHLMAIVPYGTTAKFEAATVKAEPKQKGDPGEVKIDALHLPAHKPHLPKDPEHNEQPEQPHLRVSPYKELGVFFIAVLLMVIAITNIPLRGLWSVLIVVVIFAIVVLFLFLGVWNTILGWISVLDIRITAGGYFTLSLTLFALWLIVILLFDRQVYILFKPGQMHVRQEIGDAEIVYPTNGITLEKERSQFFRHWILGFGSGDLIVRTAGANPKEIHMPNVLRIGRKEREIAQLLAEIQVVPGQM